jgi:hypothetical protein
MAWLAGVLVASVVWVVGLADGSELSNPFDDQAPGDGLQTVVIYRYA